MPETKILESALLRKHGFANAFSLRSSDPVSDLRAVLGERPLYQVHQVHGARVVRAEGAVDDLRKVEADALIARGDVFVGVRVADCVPVLAGAIGGGVAAIHAGWRGVVQGIVAKALAELAKDGSGRKVAAIGPCIGSCCFEVGADVARQIEEASGGAGVVARREGEKAYVDLRKAVRAQLRAAGLFDEDIEDVPGCTKCDAARFFSFRRDGANAGRHLGVIAPQVA